MLRGIRLFEKKRGERRTVLPSAGRFGEEVLYGFFLMLGLAGTIYLLANTILPEWRANRHVVESRCRVLDKRVGSQPQLGLSRYRPEIQIEYQVDGVWQNDPTWTYNAANEFRFDEPDAEAILEQFVVGKEYKCWYDPRNPSFVVVVRLHWWPWTLLVVTSSFVVFGGVGLAYSLLHARTSAERRLSRQTGSGKTERRSRQRRPAAVVYPAVPSVQNIVNSPGTQLAFRLPIDASPRWRLVGLGATVLLWNGLVSYMAYQAIRGYLHGEPNWLLISFLLPFVAGGIWLAVAWIRQLLSTTGVGATRLEVDDHPFRPGRNYPLCIAQAGRLKVNRLEILLVCDERATYYQGTDTRLDNQRVFERVVYEKSNFEIEPRAAFEEEFTIDIPSAAMHSYASDHNEIAWALVVRGDVAHWPDFDRRFPVCIYPLPPLSAWPDQEGNPMQIMAAADMPLSPTERPDDVRMKNRS